MIDQFVAFCLRKNLLVALCLAFSLVGPTPASAQNGNWQLHKGSGERHSFGRTIPDKDSAGYLSGARIPAQNDGGWASASSDLTVRWTGPGGVPCRSQAAYTYFQTIVRPTSTDGYRILFINVDDAARITVFNARNPDGLAVPEGTVGLRESKMVDLTSSLVPGAANRIVVTLADVCGNSAGLTAQLQIVPNGRTPNGRTEASAAPVPAEGSRTPTGIQAPAKIQAAPAGNAAAAQSIVAFVSADGSAIAGSRSVFTLINTATGEKVVVPVIGQGAETRTEIAVLPGTYTVTPPPPSINDLMSFTTRSVSTGTITANARGRATVTFSLAAQVAPLILSANNITKDSVTLAWGVSRQVKVTGFVLLRTDGRVPAATPMDGTPVNLGRTTDRAVVVRALAPGRVYSFTLFAVSAGGEAIPPRSLTVETARATPGAAAFALAPNTIVPTDFASLRAQRVGETQVRVMLNAGKVQRGSGSPMPGMDTSQTSGAGCAVGAPFLLKTDVAGNNSFWGVVDACETGGSAIINTDVPLDAVFNYYHLTSVSDNSCYDAQTGQNVGAAICDAPVPAAGAPTFKEEVGRPPVNRAGAPAFKEEVGRPPVNRAGAPAFKEEVGRPPVNRAGTPPFKEEVGRPVRSQGGLGIAKGTNLVPNQRYYSATRAHYLVLQTDGNLVVYDAGGRFVWGLNLLPNVNHRSTGRVTWQTDGNLVAYTADNRFVWSALTSSPDRNADLFITNDGVLQIVSSGRVLWSATAPPQPVPAPRVRQPSPDPDELGSARQSVLAVSDDRPNGAEHAPGESARNAVYTVYSPLSPDWNAPVSYWDSDLMRANPYFILAAGKSSKIKCEKSGSTVAALNPFFGPKKDINIELKDRTVNWNVQVGVEASIDPLFEAEAGIECALDLPGKAIQISTYPIPVNLELKPDISASAQGKISLKGPKIGITLGVESKGYVQAAVKTCTWFDIPCGLNIKMDQKTKPFATLIKGDATAVLQGTLTFKAGVEANLGIGVKNVFVTAKAGLSMKLAPLSAELKAQLGTSRCLNASLGYQLGADFLAETYVLAWGKEKRVPLWESGHMPYPGAQFTLGQCADDD